MPSSATARADPPTKRLKPCCRPGSRPGPALWWPSMCPPASAGPPDGCSAGRRPAPISPSVSACGSRAWCRIGPCAGWGGWSGWIWGSPGALLESLPPEQPLGLGGPCGGRQVAARAPRPSANPAADKYARGRLLVVAGSDAYRGAAHLALAGATAAGVGSLRAVVPPQVADHLWMVLPHVVLEERPLAEGGLERLDGMLVRWLAVAGLDHALAGCRAVRERGPGGATPLAVTESLAHAPFPPPSATKYRRRCHPKEARPARRMDPYA